MAGVTLEKVTKEYPNGFKAVTDLDLDIVEGEFLVMVGPSGCGKSTTLRMIAGLEEISYGTLKIGDRVVNDVQPKRLTPAAATMIARATRLPATLWIRSRSVKVIG